VTQPRFDETPAAFEPDPSSTLMHSLCIRARGAQYVDRDLPIDLKGTVGRLHDINILADSMQCKSSE